MKHIQKVAVIGLGSIALRHRRNLKTSYPAASILAMSASGRIPAEPIEYADEVVPDIISLIEIRPYLVIIASPSSIHAQQAMPLIKAGIPVLIEKPVTATVSDSSRLIKFAAKHQTPIAVGYCLRYLSSSLIMKSLIDDQVIGKIYNLQAEVGQFLPDWRPDKKVKETVSANESLGGGALLELSHELDYIQWLIGDLTVEYAQLRHSKELDLDVEELADMVLTTKTGTVCNVHLDFLQKQALRHCHFIGSKGRLNWDLLNNTISLHSSLGDNVVYSEPEWDKNQMYLAMIEDFVNQIEGNSHQCISLNQAATTVRLVEQIKQISVQGVTQ